MSRASAPPSSGARHNSLIARAAATMRRERPALAPRHRPLLQYSKIGWLSGLWHENAGRGRMERN